MRLYYPRTPFKVRVALPAILANSLARGITLVFDFDEVGFPDPEAIEFELVKVDNNKIYLKESDGWIMRFEKL